MSDTLTVDGLGQLLASVPPYTPDLALDLLRREQAVQGLIVPKLTAISTAEARDARVEIDRYRDQVDALRKKLITLEPTTATAEVPEFGL